MHRWLPGLSIHIPLRFGLVPGRCVAIKAIFMKTIIFVTKQGYFEILSFKKFQGFFFNCCTQIAKTLDIHYGYDVFTFSGSTKKI